jgi:hypothetical protein
LGAAQSQEDLFDEVDRESLAFRDVTRRNGRILPAPSQVHRHQ